MKIDESKATRRDMPSGSASRSALDLALHRARHLERVGGRLLDHAQPDRRIAVDAHHLALVERAEARAAHVAQPHRVAAALADDHVVELADVAQVGLGEHRELALRRLDAPGRDLDVLAPQRVLHVLHRERVGRQPLAVDPQAHRVLALAADDHRGDPGQRLQSVGDVAVDVIREFERDRGARRRTRAT